MTELRFRTGRSVRVMIRMFGVIGMVFGLLILFLSVGRGDTVATILGAGSLCVGVIFLVLVPRLMGERDLRIHDQGIVVPLPRVPDRMLPWTDIAEYSMRSGVAADNWILALWPRGESTPILISGTNLDDPQQARAAILEALSSHGIAQQARPLRKPSSYALMLALIAGAALVYAGIVYRSRRNSSNTPPVASGGERGPVEPPGVSGKRIAVIAPDLNVGWQSGFRFSADGNSVTYVAETGGKFCVVRGEQRGDLFEAADWPVLSPDGASVAYVVKDGAHVRVTAGGAKGESFDEIQNLTFSADGRVVAYRARSGGSWLMTVGETEGAPYDDVGLPVLSRDGSVVAYRARKDGKRFIVVGAVEGERYWGAADPVLHPEGRIVAHIATRPDAMWMVVNGKSGEEWDEIGYPVFSGEVVAYVAMRKGKAFLVRGDEKRELAHPPHFGFIPDLFFSPDGKSFAYISRSGSSCSLSYEGVRGGEVYGIRDVAFRSDGRVAYWAKNTDHWYLAPDGYGADHLDWTLGPPTFTPEGSAVRYPALIRKCEIWWRELAVK